MILLVHNSETSHSENEDVHNIPQSPEKFAFFALRITLTIRNHFGSNQYSSSNLRWRFCCHHSIVCVFWEFAPREIQVRSHRNQHQTKASLDNSVHVSKVQFDKEFSIYQKIWISLVTLRAKTLSLRPILDFQDPNETEDERVARRLKAFADAFTNFRDDIEQNKPFYSILVYKSLVEVINLCHKESIEFEHKAPGWSKEYWDNSRENNKKIVDGIDECCELIRQRISSFSVVG